MWQWSLLLQEKEVVQQAQLWVRLQLRSLPWTQNSLTREHFSNRGRRPTKNWTRPRILLQPSYSLRCTMEAFQLAATNLLWLLNTTLRMPSRTRATFLWETRAEAALLEPTICSDRSTYLRRKVDQVVLWVAEEDQMLPQRQWQGSNSSSWRRW